MSSLRGDAEACLALGRVAQRVAGGLAEQTRDLTRAVPGWAGAAAEADLQGRRTLAQDLSAQADRLAALGQALTTFGAALAQAQRAAFAADCLPRAAPADIADQARAVRRAQEQADHAHNVLLARLQGLAGPVAQVGPARPVGPEPPRPPWRPGPADALDLANSLVMAPTVLAGEASRRAATAGLQARALKDARRTGSAAERAAARTAWREALRHYRGLADQERAFSATAARHPAPAWLSRINTPLSHSVPVLQRIPIASVLVVGVGTSADVADGKSAPLALTKNVSSAAAGMAAFSGTTSALIAAGAVGGPVVLGAVAVGAVVSIGVGAAVEHWGDDVADAGRGAARGVTRGVAGAWNALRG